MPNLEFKFYWGSKDIYFSNKEFELFIFNMIGLINSVMPLIWDRLADKSVFL